MASTASLHRLGDVSSVSAGKWPEVARGLAGAQVSLTRDSLAGYEASRKPSYRHRRCTIFASCWSGRGSEGFGTR